MKLYWFHGPTRPRGPKNPRLKNQKNCINSHEKDEHQIDLGDLDGRAGGPGDAEPQVLEYLAGLADSLEQALEVATGAAGRQADRQLRVHVENGPAQVELVHAVPAPDMPARGIATGLHALVVGAQVDDVAGQEARRLLRRGVQHCWVFMIVIIFFFQG